MRRQFETDETLRGKLKGKSRRRRDSLSMAIVPHTGSDTGRNDILPNLEFVHRAPEELQLPQRNVRSMDPDHVREVARSIAALGFSVPVLIDARGTIIDGGVRVAAARNIGLSEIPCLVVSHQTKIGLKLLRLALNRLQEKGEWDLDALRLEFEELILEDAPIDISGFSTVDIDQLLVDETAPVTEPGPVEPEPNARPVAQPGDVFALGEHRIICGDATDSAVLKVLMDDDVARMILTDEPYNVAICGHVTGGRHREFLMASGEMSNAEFALFNRRWMEATLPYLQDGGIFGTFIDWRGYPVVHAATADAKLTPLNLVVWAKTNAGMGSLYRSQHELLPLYKKGKSPHLNNVELGRHGRWRSNLWTYPGASSLGSDARQGLKDHPTVKPVAMLEDALLDLSARDEIVLDPFLGSGSTLIAAEKTGRRCLGVELDPLYVDLIIRRYAIVSGKMTTCLTTGEPFTEIARRRGNETS